MPYGPGTYTKPGRPPKKKPEKKPGRPKKEPPKLTYKNKKWKKKTK